ncbi:prepilin peptidase [Candidatus Aerophobetes bacterium]|nr:prepilin peptidase [Candidatus Aerophobetes bacterium]
MEAGLFLLISYLGFVFLHQPGMGMGDMKLAAGIRAFSGWKVALLFFSLIFLQVRWRQVCLFFSSKGNRGQNLLWPLSC